MKTYIILLCLLFSACSGPDLKNGLSLLGMREATVTLFINGKNSVDYCSGVVIGSAQTNSYIKLTVLTAKHCSESSEKEYQPVYQAVTYYGDIGFIWGTTKTRRDDVETMTFIFSPLAKIPPVATFVKDPPEPGDQLTVVGSPDFYMWKVQKFDYQGQAIDYEHPSWRYDAEMLGYCGDGDSGAGVWNEDGFLVGDLNAGDNRFCYFLPSKYIRGDFSL